LLKKVSASNPERYQIIRRSFRVLKSGLAGGQKFKHDCGSQWK
jgi:hypothetical protein